MRNWWALLIVQPFRHFTYVTTRFPTLPSLYLRHSSFSNHSVASPAPQLILQPFFRFSYVTGSSLTLPGEPPMLSNQFWHHQGWLVTMIFMVHIGSAFSELPTPGVFKPRPAAACGPQASFMRPGKGIWQNTMRYEYWVTRHCMTKVK